MTPVTPASLRALLAESVDYAGLFPPAGLALLPALANYSTYAREANRWMLACFVMPTAKLVEAGPLLAERFDFTHPLRISALGAKSSSADDFLENLHVSLGEIVRFQQAHGRQSTTDQFEAPLPLGLATAVAIRTVLRQAATSIETLLPGRLSPFWEVPFSETLPEILRGFAAHNAEVPRDARCRPFGVKLRTGGMDAAAFPTPGQLAAALLAARDAGVALKFTAGLHHPFRHFNAGLGTHMHGFINVYAAGFFARELRPDEAEVQAILEDEQPKNFSFDHEGLTWCDRHIPTNALAAHRQFITSFGSCSFDEPRDDLRQLGLLA